MQEIQEARVPSLGQEDPLEQGNWQPTQVLLPGKFHGQGVWWVQSMGSQRVRHD